MNKLEIVQTQGITNDRWLIVINISLIDVKHYEQSTTERWKIVFHPCNENGQICISDFGKLASIVFDIETWYIQDECVANKVRLGLAEYKIHNIHKLIEAFKYRRMYFQI